MRISVPWFMFTDARLSASCPSRSRQSGQARMFGSSNSINFCPPPELAQIGNFARRASLLFGDDAKIAPARASAREKSVGRVGDPVERIIGHDMIDLVRERRPAVRVEVARAAPAEIVRQRIEVYVWREGEDLRRVDAIVPGEREAPLDGVARALVPRGQLHEREIREDLPVRLRAVDIDQADFHF